MSIEQDSLEVVVPEQLAAVSDEFVTFLKKYYEWMSTDGQPSQLLSDSIAERNLWTATQDYLDYLYKEFGYAWIENPEADRANIVARLSDIYKTRGSIDSIKILFRALFGEEVEVKLPKNFILKPSTGLWAQEFSVICDLEYGDPNDVIGRYSTVYTQFPGQPLQQFDVEIKSINPRGPGVYELYISRFFAGFFFDGSYLVFNNTKFNVRESLSNIVATTVPGATFNAGDAYSIQHYKRNQTWDYINDELTGTTQTWYQNRFEKYFEPRVFKRWYRDITKVNLEKQEQVEQYSFTDGTIVEEVTRDRLTKTIVTRGNSLLTTYKATDGTTKQEQKTIPDGDFIVAPDITINWDDLIIQMIQYVEGIGSPALASFLEEEVGGYQRGDINNDGVIDRVDIENLLRRVTGRTVPAAYHQWIDQKLGQEIRSREIGAALEIGEGTGAWYRVTEVGTGGTIQNGLIFSFGYGYPTVYTAVLVPANGLIDDHAEVVFSSKLVAVSAAEYRDRKGFVSDVNKIFDNYYYQEFSYVVESSLDNEVVENVIQRTVHPAGQKLFSERVIIVNMEYTGIGLSSEHHRGYPSIVSNLFTEIQMELVRAGDEVFGKPWKYVEKSLTEENGYPDPFVVDDPLWKFDAEKFIEAANGYNEGTEISDYRWKFKEKNLIPGSGYDENLSVGYDVIDKDVYKPRSDAIELSNEVYYNHPNKYRQDDLEFTDNRYKQPNKYREDGTEISDVYFQEPNKYREDGTEISDVYFKEPNKYREDGTAVSDVVANHAEKTAYAEGFEIEDLSYRSVAKTIIYDFGNTGSSNPYFEEFDGDWPDAPDYMFNQFDYVFDTPGRINGVNISDTFGIYYSKGTVQESLTIGEVYRSEFEKAPFYENIEIQDSDWKYSIEKYFSEVSYIDDRIFYSQTDKFASDSFQVTDYVDKVIGRDVFSYNTQVEDVFDVYFEKGGIQNNIEITSEVFDVSFEKNYSDDTEISDSWYNHLDKLLGDGIEIVDVVDNSFDKYRQDGTEISDVFAVSTEKPFADSTELSDVYVNHIDKSRGDGIEINDVQDKDITKPFAESLSTGDVQDKFIEKPFADSTELSDVYVNHIDKLRGEGLSVTDIADASFIKSLAEALDINDVFAVTYEKPFAESIATGDVYETHVDKYRTDSIEIAGQHFSSIAKPFSESIEIGDISSASYYKYKTDGLEINDALNSEFEKYKTDSIEISTTFSNRVEKPITNTLEVGGSGVVENFRDYVEDPETYFVDNEYVPYGVSPQTF
jgi:hypothetical protein